MSLTGYTVLSLLRINESHNFLLFGAVLIYLLCDLIRLYGFEKEFNVSRDTHNEQVTKSLSILFSAIGILYILLIGYIIFVRQLARLAIVMLYIFKVFTSFFGLGLLGTYRHHGLKMTKLLLTLVYFSFFLLNCVIAFQLFVLQVHPLFLGIKKY